MSWLSVANTAMVGNITIAQMFISSTLVMFFTYLDNFILVGLGIILAIAFTSQPWIFTTLMIALILLVLNKPLFSILNKLF